MPGLTADGFSAWVSIDGVKLPPYGVETTTVKSVKTVTGWIASEVDKAFEVGYSIPAYPEALGGDFFVDGIKFEGCIHKLGKLDSLTRSSKRVSNTMARPLIFSRAEFTDEDAYMNTARDGLGEIIVKIWVVEPLGRQVQKYNLKEEPTKIHERVKKAISHQITFGKEFVTAPSAETFRDCIDKRCVITFVFKYRPKDYLCAEGIIPLSPKPDTRTRKRAAETLEPSISGDEEETEAQTQDEELRLRQEELRVQREKLEVQRRELRIQKEEMQLQKEELRIRSEELKIQLDTVKGKAKTQRKKAKLEPQEAKLQAKPETIDLT